MTYYKHPNALVESDSIGEGTRIWAFAHVLDGAVIGEECNICDNVFVEGGTSIGNRVTVKCGVQLWSGVVLEDDVFVGPNVTFTNDPFPRSKQYLQQFPKTIVRERASIGANATILPGVVIGLNAMIGAGAVVTRNVPHNAIVVGNPARITGYVSSIGNETSKGEGRSAIQKNTSESTPIPGVVLHHMPIVEDTRGALSFGEYEKHLPFIPKRYFIVYGVPSKEVRGEHAHRKLQQFLICVAGSCSVVVDNGRQRQEIELDSPAAGLYVRPMVWATQYKYSRDAVLLVLASEEYCAQDYIRDYDQFLKEVEEG